MNSKLAGLGVGGIALIAVGFVVGMGAGPSGDMCKTLSCVVCCMKDSTKYAACLADCNNALPPKAEAKKTGASAKAIPPWPRPNDTACRDGCNGPLRRVALTVAQQTGTTPTPAGPASTKTLKGTRARVNFCAAANCSKIMEACVKAGQDKKTCAAKAQACMKKCINQP